MSLRSHKEKANSHQRLVQSYYETTSKPGREGALEDYRKNTAGLARGLGEWLDVTGKRVVDLGSGTGELCWLCVDRGAIQVVGINLSQGEIDHAAAYVDAEFVCADVLGHLHQQETGSIDRIFALNILEHLPTDTLVDLLEEAVRVLSPDGQLIAMVPNATSPFGAMTRYWDFTHYRAFTPSSVRQLKNLTGFDEVAFREWGPRPHGVISGVRFLFWQLIRVLIGFRLLVETGSTKERIYTADMLFRLLRNQQSK